MTQDEVKPYSKLKITKAYLSYFISGKTKHGIHSPTVYDFIENIIDKAYKSKSKSIENERTRLKKSKQVIDFKDYGKYGNIFRKNISDIARASLKSAKYATLLSQLVKYYKAKRVLEVGTSLGITTAYLAQNKDILVDTYEGDHTVANLAQGVWNQLGLTNVSSIVGNFDATLSEIDDVIYDVIYIDGNHKLDPTLRYFDQLQKNASESTVFIFDDIHYSKQMEEAWKQIKEMSKVSITIDLFFLGIVFMDPTLSKQNFILRY
ncbi:MAG: SAM-dependent methyltransferase [Bacteroidetes bacterium]|nr:MAG: SAM-dependent methyltransferase [Bacteroidota bacterium]